MWKGGNTHTLSMRMQIGAVAMENSMEVQFFLKTCIECCIETWLKIAQNWKQSKGLSSSKQINCIYSYNGIVLSN